MSHTPHSSPAAQIASLAERRDLLLSHSSFKTVLQPTSCVHYLVPPSRDAELPSRLRAPSKLPRILNRTKKYQSFVSIINSFYHVIYVYFWVCHFILSHASTSNIQLDRQTDKSWNNCTLQSIRGTLYCFLPGMSPVTANCSSFARLCFSRTLSLNHIAVLHSTYAAITTPNATVLFKNATCFIKNTILYSKKFCAFIFWKTRWKTRAIWEITFTL